MPPRLFRHGELPLVLLTVLHRQPSHGYQLLAELNALFGARYSASPGSIYPALETLEKHGLLVGTDVAGRRVYGVSVDGAQALERRRDEVVALEARLGVRLLGGDAVEQALDRLTAEVRAQRGLADPARLVGVLDDAADRLRSLSSASPTPAHDGETR